MTVFFPSYLTHIFSELFACTQVGAMYSEEACFCALSDMAVFFHSYLTHIFSELLACTQVGAMYSEEA
jgi:hypothetical protein